jgi:hypothetical protein
MPPKWQIKPDNCSNWFDNQAKAIKHRIEHEHITKVQVGLQKLANLWFSQLE